jgi:hypothetical protein
LGRLLPVATASPCALFEAYNIGERLGWKGDFWGLLPDRKAAALRHGPYCHRSFRVAAIRKNLVPGMMDSFFG